MNHQQAGRQRMPENMDNAELVRCLLEARKTIELQDAQLEGLVAILEGAIAKAARLPPKRRPVS